jgi:hypothetical protein
MRTGLLALATALLASAAAPAADPAIVFQTQPPGRLLGDLRSVAKLVGGEAAVKEFNDNLKEKLGDKGLQGIDLTRPVVGYVVFGEKIEKLVVVVAVPVSGEKEFLDFLERATGQKPKDPKDGLHELKAPDGGDAKVMMRFDSQYAYVGIGADPTAALAAKSLVAPANLYDPAEKALAAARVRFDRLPKELRDQLADGLKQLKTKLAELRLPADAAEPARQAVDELVNLGTRYTDLLQDADSATARVLLDPDSGEAGLEVGLTGKPGSPLAKQIGDWKPTTNKFAGLITPDTVAGLRLQLPLFAKELQKAADIGLEAARKQIGAQAPPEFKGTLDELFKGLTRTVNAGEFDVAVSFRGPDKDGLYTLVGAVAFEDPSALEKELRTLVTKQLPPAFQDLITFDAAKVGQTSIHEAKLGAFLPPEAQKVFGEQASATFAFAPHGIYVAFGPDAIGTMKAALEVKKGESPPLEVVVNPARIKKLLLSFGVEVPESVGNQDKLIPALAVSLEGGKELRFRVGTNLKWLEGFGAFAGQAGAAPPKPKPAP